MRIERVIVYVLTVFTRRKRVRLDRCQLAGWRVEWVNGKKERNNKQTNRKLKSERRRARERVERERRKDYMNGFRYAQLACWVRTTWIAFEYHHRQVVSAMALRPPIDVDGMFFPLHFFFIRYFLYSFYFRKGSLLDELINCESSVGFASDDVNWAVTSFPSDSNLNECPSVSASSNPIWCSFDVWTTNMKHFQLICKWAFELNFNELIGRQFDWFTAKRGIT